MLWMLMGVAVGAPNCTKGKPCGNTCIAMDKTCHTGIGSYRPVPSSSYRPLPTAAPPPPVPTLVRDLAPLVITKDPSAPEPLAGPDRDSMLAATTLVLESFEANPQETVATLLRGIDPADYGLMLDGEELLGLFPAYRVLSLGSLQPGVLVVSTWGLQFFPWDGAAWSRKWSAVRGLQANESGTGILIQTAFAHAEFYLDERNVATHPGFVAGLCTWAQRESARNTR
jgi:hypothetical protein